MKKVKLISALTVVMISSGFLVSCNRDNTQNNTENALSMNPADNTDIDTNTGTHTGNIYAEEEEITTPLANEYSANKAKVNPKGDPKLMDNPSAVQHAADQGKREKGAIYVNQPEGYVDQTVNSADSGAPVNKGNKTAMSQKSNLGVGSNPNQKRIADLKKQANDLLRKEMALKNKIKDAQLTPTYKLGVKNPRGPAAAAINQEISSFQAQRVKLQQQIASLQKAKK
jgi:hypothetical protein